MNRKSENLADHNCVQKRCKKKSNQLTSTICRPKHIAAIFHSINFTPESRSAQQIGTRNTKHFEGHSTTKIIVYQKLRFHDWPIHLIDLFSYWINLSLDSRLNITSMERDLACILLNSAPWIRDISVTKFFLNTNQTFDFVILAWIMCLNSTFDQQIQSSKFTLTLNWICSKISHFKLFEIIMSDHYLHDLIFERWEKQNNHNSTAIMVDSIVEILWSVPKSTLILLRFQRKNFPFSMLILNQISRSI